MAVILALVINIKMPNRFNKNHQNYYFLASFALIKNAASAKIWTKFKVEDSLIPLNNN